MEPSNTFEILKACYTANGLSVLEPNTEFEVLNAVYNDYFEVWVKCSNDA